jgi:endoglycosylceramidase
MDRMSRRFSWRAALSSLVVFVITCLVTLPAVGVGAAIPTPIRYSTNGLWITDAQGRDLFLRGVDVTGDEDTPTTAPLPYDAADFLAMRSDGATVVRIPIAWALIEPTPGQYDEAAIKRVVQIVGWAGAAGLKVVLDMHQYIWTACFGGNGVPRWAVPNCPATPPTNVAQQEADVLIAENTFWKSASLQSDFAKAWVQVAEAVDHPSYLIGYDILNEPGPGLIPNEVFEEDYLAPFYRSVGTQLRRVDPGSLLFVEPSILNGLVNGTSQFLLPIGLSRLVYEPHQYGAVSLNVDSTISVFDLAGPAQFVPDLTLDFAIAKRIGAAIWLGEWGAINPAASYRPTNYVEDDLTEQDHFMLGSAYWSYDSSLRGSNVAIGQQLTRITPFAISGTPLSLSTGTSSMTLSWLSNGGQTTVSYPSTCKPITATTGGPAVVASAGNGFLGITAPTGQRETVVVHCS